MQTLNRVRRWLGRPLVAPLGADPPSGSFEVIGRRCVGTVIDEYHPPFSDMVVEIETDDRRVLKSAFVKRANSNNQYDFSFDLEPSFELRDFLTEHLVVCAMNGFHVRSKLQLDGSSQLSLIREFSGGPREVLFDLDFTPGGNSQQYIRSGFSHPEPKFAWTDGPEARLELTTTLSSQDRYELAISCSPFLAPPVITSQRMLLRLNGYPQNQNLDGKHLGFLSFRFPTGSFNDTDSLALEFEFPDSCRPADIDKSRSNRNPDTRQLAFAFKRMTFARLLSE